MNYDENLSEVSPPGWTGTVKAMKQKHPDKFGDGKGKINPYALAWSMKKKGYEPHYKDEESSNSKKKPEKKDGFKEWLSQWEDAQDHGAYCTSNPNIWTYKGKFFPKLGVVHPVLSQGIST